MSNYQHIKIEKIAGKHGQASVEFSQATFRSSADGNMKKHVDDDFGPALIDEVIYKKPIFAKQQGLFKKSYSCRACGQPLEVIEVAPVEFAIKVVYKQFDPFTLTIIVPGMLCSACKTANAVQSRQIESDICDAMIAAFESENIGR